MSFEIYTECIVRLREKKMSSNFKQYLLQSLDVEPFVNYKRDNFFVVKWLFTLLQLY